jgi:hypothetical protein
MSRRVMVLGVAASGQAARNPGFTITLPSGSSTSPDRGSSPRPGRASIRTSTPNVSH